MRRARLIVLLLTACAAMGCAARRTVPATRPSGLAEPVPLAELDARCVPPLGWKADPLETANGHAHQVWISPVGGTAYGVIYFALPLPVGEEIALWGFLREMKNNEGEATLLSKTHDDGRLRFVAEGGKYRIRGTVLTRGFHGWVVYAGTLRQRPVRVDDLELAVQARENTRLGL